MFRQAALDALSSPEQLDRTLVVTKPLGWLALTGVGIAIAAALVWSVMGSIPTTVQSRGLLIREGGLHSIASLGPGAVRQFRCEIGSHVKAGDTIAIIEAPELALRQENSWLAVREADSVYRMMIGALATYQSLQKATATSQEKENRARLAAAEQRVDHARRKAESTKGLQERGLVTSATYFEELNTLLTAEQDLIAARTSTLQLESTTSDDALQKRQQLLQQEQQLRAALRTARETDLQYSLVTTVISPYDGRVVQLSSNVGQLVTNGSPLMVLEVDKAHDTPVDVVLFVPPLEGKKIEIGMDAHIVPSTVTAEESGSLIGDVLYVSEYPLDQRGMASLIENEGLLSYFGVQQEPPVEVRVRLRPNKAAPSGYTWTSGKGPDIRVTAGMVCTGSIIVKDQAPITLALPWLRRKLGLSNG